MMISLSLAVATAFLATGCASLFSKSKYMVKMDSNPRGATVFVVNPEGDIAAQAVTPGYVTLKSGHGSNDTAASGPAFYSIVFVKNGYRPYRVYLSAETDPMFYFNVIFLPGMELDRKTGAAWKLKENIQVKLTRLDRPTKISDAEFISQYKRKLARNSASFKSQQGLE